MERLPVLVRVVNDKIFFRKAMIKNGEIVDVDYFNFYVATDYNNELIHEKSSKGYEFYYCNFNEFEEYTKITDFEKLLYGRIGWSLQSLFDNYKVYFYDDKTRERFNIRAYIDYVNELDNSYPDFDYTCNVKPFYHQIIGAKYILREKNALLFWETGTGKTLSSLLALDYLFRKGDIVNTLIVVPNSLVLNWYENHIKKYYPHYNYLDVMQYNTTVNEDNPTVVKINDFTIEERLALLKTLSKGKFILITNYDTFSRIEHTDNLSFKYDYVIFDECHMLKNQSKRTSRIHKILNFKYCAMLTGTPIDGKYIDYYNQFIIAKKDKPFYTLNRTDFVRRYYRTYGYNAKSYSNVYLILRYISENSIELRKEQCFDLPEKIYSKINIQLDAVHMKKYNDFIQSLTLDVEDIHNKIAELTERLMFAEELDDKEKEELISQLKSLLGRKGRDYVASILPKMLYARMIVNGVFYSGRNNKIEWLKENILENEKYVIYTSFTHTINRISNELREHNSDLKIERIYGDIDVNRRFDIVRRFNNNGNVNIIVANPKVGGVGIDLVAAHTCIFFDNDYSYIVRKQAEDRLHRIGQKNNVEYIDLVAVQTIDEYIYSLITDKKDISEELSKINTTEKLKKMLSGGENA